MMKLFSWLILVFCIFLNSCSSDKSGKENSKKYPAKTPKPALKTYPSGAIISDTLIHDFAVLHPKYLPFEDVIKNFYLKRAYQYVWLNKYGLNPRVNMFVNLTQENYTSKKLNSDSIHSKYARLLIGNTGKIAENLRDLELDLTASFFLFASSEWGENNKNLMTQTEWFIPGKSLDYESILDTLLLNKKDAYKPPVYRQYELLKKFLFRYRQIELEGGWPKISIESKSLKEGDTSVSISTIKKRLKVTSDFIGNDTSEIFDTALTQGVKNFQRRYGMLENGIISDAVVREMNTDVHERIEQLIVNIERCKWVPVKQDGVYLVVNLPEYKLHAYEGDNYLWNMNVVVGTATNKTVIFTGGLKYVVLNPYWNVPSSIIEKEILPKLRNDPGYIGKQQMEVIKTNTPDKVLDPFSIDWSKPAAQYRMYTIRQTPGIHNALGKIKFLFPNEYNIYLHDTPSKSLFERTSRSFSHGCIRLSEPENLALFLLKGQGGWDKKSLDKAFDKKKEQYIVLKKSIPVFIVYFTAWVDREGKLNFRDDIYQHDAVMAKLLMQTPGI